MPLELFKKSGAAEEQKKHRAKNKRGKKIMENSEAAKKAAKKAMETAMGMFGKGKRKLIF